MKKLFQTYTAICSKYKNSAELIDILFSFLTDDPRIDNSIDDFLYKNLKKKDSIDPISVIQLIGLIHQKEKENTKIDKTDERKHFGIYYTDYEIAKQITKEALKNKKNLLALKFLEPCSGVGVFALSFIDYIFPLSPKFTNEKAQQVIDNIYCADIDKKAIDLLKKIIPLYVKFKYNKDIKLNEKNCYAGNVLFDISENGIRKNDLKEIFNIKDGFDIVLTNPPYKLLKENSNKYGKKDDFRSIKHLVSFIKKNKIYKHNEGTLNYYKIFIEEIIENYTNKNSGIGLLIPITLLNDRQSEKLRKRMIEKYSFSKIYIIPEKNSFFPDISQAFCFFALDKSKQGKTLEINPEVISSDDFEKRSVKINIETIKSISESAPIIVEDEKGWGVLKKINNHPRVKSFSDIKNLRGELDLTLDKSFITNQKTSYPLLKGINIAEFDFDLGNLYVDENFIMKLNGKREHVSRDRIVCQQVSNIHGNKRLKFSKIPANVILGNSCNYISKHENLFEDKNISLDYLLGVLNSLLLDWRFKITNSNNHISNYEIAELPIAVPDKKQKIKIESLVSKIKKGKKDEDVAELNLEIFKLYQLTKDEINFILSKYQEGNLISTINKNINYAI
jgi:Alw26I/Eco31I/Esp3I family type II restriction m6 adenine DNA methyltransferase